MKKIFALCYLVTCINVYPQEKKVIEFDQGISGVKNLVLSPNGELLLSLHQDNTIHIRNLKSKESTQVIKPSQWTYKVSFTADGKYLAFGNARNSIWIWDIKNNKLVDTIACDLLEPHAIDFSPNRPQLVYAERNGTIKVWSLIENEVIYKTKLTPGCSYITFSPDGNNVAVATERKVVLWNFQSDIKIYLTGHEAKIESVKFSPNGKIVATGSRDKKIRFFESNSGILKNKIEVEFPAESCLCNKDLSFSPDGKYFAYLTPWSIIKILSPTSWKNIKEIEEYQITAFVFAPDGKKIIYGLDDGSIKMVDL